MPSVVIAKIKAFEKPIFITRPPLPFRKKEYGKLMKFGIPQWLTTLLPRACNSKLNLINTL
jgi:hypothetical protein